MWRWPAEALVRIVDQMEDSLITRGKRRPRNSLSETIKKDLDCNSLTVGMTYNRTLCCCMINVIHVADLT